MDPDFEQIINIAREDLSSWDNTCSGDNVNVYKKMTGDSPIMLLRTIAHIQNIPPDIVFETIANQEVRRGWDKVLSNFEIIEDHPEKGVSILYYMIKTPIGVSNRDFLQQRKVRKNYPAPGMITMHFKSVTHPKCPEKPKTVRAETIISGYIIEPEGINGTKLTSLS